MLPISETPLYVSECTPGYLRLDSNSVYLYEISSEERSQHVERLKTNNPGSQFVEVKSDHPLQLNTGIQGSPLLSLRSSTKVKDFLVRLNPGPLYIDITGMPHNTWAPLIKVAMDVRETVYAVYVEPNTYAYSTAPRDGDIFDLSEKTNGISPIPQFHFLQDVDEATSFFIPFLGFEGARFKFLLESVQPTEQNIYPIIGVPGFKPEYPFYTYLSNANPLEGTGSFSNVRFAKSNCPFSAFYQLCNIATKHQNSHFKIALTGTKPHALGAVLFASSTKHSAELIYDQVKRSEKRTSGHSQCLVYGLSEFSPSTLKFAA